MRTHNLNIEALAEQAAGNWQRFESFGWHDQPEDAEQWCIVYTNNRDSGLLDQSNADAIASALEPYIEDGTVVPEHHGHWGCGWVDGYAIRVYNAPGGSITPAFAQWCELQEAMDNYPVLDDEDYSRREYEATIEAIEQRCKFAGLDAPEDWAGEVFSWLWENDQRQCENRDDQGAYPSDESIQAALKELGWLEPEYDDSIPWTIVRCPVCCRTVDADDCEGTLAPVPAHLNPWDDCPGAGCLAPVEPNK